MWKMTDSVFHKSHPLNLETIHKMFPFHVVPSPFSAKSDQKQNLFSPPRKVAANAPQHPCGSAAENASQSSCASHIKSTRPASQSSCARRRRKKFKSVFFQDMRLEKDTAHEISADNFEEIEAEISCSPSQNGPAVLKQKNTRGKGFAFSPSKRQLRCAACSMGRE